MTIEPGKPEQSPSEISYCVFKAGDRDFMIQVEQVREIIDFAPVFPLPLAPAYIRGVVPLRGDVVPAIDLARLHNVENAAYDHAKLVVVEEGNETIGFICETIPFFITLGAGVAGESIIDVSEFFKKHRIREHARGQN